jgi:hemoglobin
LTTFRYRTALTLASLVLASGLYATETKKTLYERLGGQPAIQAVANNLVDRILADKRVNPWFAQAAASPENTAAYKAKLAEFLCQSTEGPCRYEGKDMMTAHRGRAVTPQAFDAVVEDLVAVLDQLKVPSQEKGDVLALLAPLKNVIVQK